MSKLGYRFHAVPRDRHPEWFNCSMLTRGLGLELYIASCVDDGKTKPIPVANNWRTSLCRTLCIEPEERSAISQCFSAMEKRGLLKVEAGAVHLVWHASDQLFTAPASPTPTPPLEPAEPPLKDPCIPPEGGLWSATPQNDSTHASQREEKREETTTHRDDGPSLASIGHDTMFNATGRHFELSEWRTQLERIGMKPASERAAVERSLLACAFRRDNPMAVSPAYALKHWDRYAAGNPPLKAAVRAASGGRRFSGPSRVPTAEEYARDAQEKAPWEM